MKITNENLVFVRKVTIRNSDFIIKMEAKYEKLEKLAENTYYSIFKAKNTLTGELCALKIIRFDMEEDGIPTYALREIAAFKALDHPGIVKLEEVVTRSDRVTIATEFLPISLRKYLQLNKPISPELVRSYSYQILSAVAYMHSHHFMHRNIKPESFLINSRGIIKLRGFSSVRSYSIPLTQMTPGLTMLWYRPPEILLGSTFYDIGVDVWSVGCVIAEMIKKEPIFTGDSDLDQVFNIFKVLGTPDDYWPETAAFPKETIPEMPKQDLSAFIGTDDPDLIDLLSRLLEIDPGKRISAREALDHPYFSQVPPSLVDLFCPEFA